MVPLFPLLATALLALAPAPQTAPDFTRDIAPILQRHCLRCHGARQAQGGLRLDTREAALASGRAIRPHDARNSPLIRRVTAADDTRMPPAPSGLPRLSDAEVMKLRAWIDAGPAWPTDRPAPQHWSLRPLRRPRIPLPAAHPIDAFVRTRLAQKKLTLSAPADRRTLLRRVFFDLIGLPPTPEEMAAFAADRRPGAYEAVVDRLLASPRYGERWARHWLDAIHFADSHGFEHDVARENAWPYRDYVIEALNRDTPWPRFVREQLAADSFYPDQPRATAALGFLGAGTFDLSAYTTAPRNFEMIDRDDLVTQTMATFASVTVNCARCHDHKFDPIPQTDYYALQAVFAGLIKGDRTFDDTAKTAAERRHWEDVRKAAAGTPEECLAPRFAALREEFLKTPRLTWTPLTVNTLASESGASLSRSGEAITSAGKRPETDTVTVTGTAVLPAIAALRLDTLTADELPMRGPGRQDNGNFHLSEIEIQRCVPGKAPVLVKIVRASADFNQENWGIERAIDGDPKSAWGIFPAVGKAHQALFVLAEPVTLARGETLQIALRQLHGGGHLIGRFRLWVTDRAPENVLVLPSTVEEILAVPEAQRTREQQAALAAFALRAAADAALARLPAPRRVYAAGRQVDVPTLGIRTMDAPRPIHVLERGDLDKPRETASPGALSAVTALPARFSLAAPDDEAARRAALADWLVHPENPLTWRSIVNRVWHHHFGRGLCDTPGDLGIMGGAPSHPELIDFLALWFRDEAQGSLKALHRLIVTSATYRQSAALRPEGQRIDSENRLLWRQNRRRLDADAYRDFTLAVSGKLDLTMGGPGIRHFTMSPGPQLTPNLDYTAYDWRAPGAGRRSIYRFVWRGIPDPFLDALDFPDLGLLAPVRSVSVSALQALALYNDAFVLRCSEALAQREGQVTSAVRRAWLRPPTATEHDSFTAYRLKYGLPALCRILLNANEFLFVD